MALIYFLVALIATIIGSMAGLGGGVIIKPVLDSLGHYDITTIGVLSSWTVFAMAIVSILRHLKSKFSLHIKSTFYIAIGSILGGVIGQHLLGFIIDQTGERLAKVIQSLLLTLLLIFIIYYMKHSDQFRPYHIKHPIGCLMIGFILGNLSSFLGIGGGPINVALLAIFFSMQAKEAAVNSIIIILFSQASSLLSLAFSQGFGGFDLSMLYFMIPAGILGALIGSKLNLISSNELIIKVFNAVVLFVLILNIYNIFSTLLL